MATNQPAVGSELSTPWLPGSSWPITQDWGPTDVSAEPSGHGSAHWHAGVDIGCPTGTHVVLPSSYVTAQCHYLTDPSGYGSDALRVTVGTQDIILGHLGGRLVPDGSLVRAGTALGTTNNEGNSSGPHLHFEVRPTGKGYGSDVDPWNDLKGASIGIPGADIGSQIAEGISKEIQAAEASVQSSFLNGGEVLVGTGALMAGMAIATLGLDRSVQLARQSASSAVRGAKQAANAVPGNASAGAGSNLRTAPGRSAAAAGHAAQAARAASQVTQRVS